MWFYFCCNSGIKVYQVLILVFTHIDDHRRHFPVAHDRTLKPHELGTASLLVLDSLSIIEANVTSLNALLNDVLPLLMRSPFTDQVVGFLLSQPCSKAILSQPGVEINLDADNLPSANFALARPSDALLSCVFDAKRLFDDYIFVLR